jgi:SAM-dependent methyltransferase
VKNSIGGTLVSGLRETFDGAALNYDAVRPEYPEALFDELVHLAGLRSGDQVLEIGPGTGQASVPLASRGLRVTAVELGPNLAAVANSRLARYPGCQVVVGDFERVQLQAGAFDLVA